jgi:hypothetical protein
VTVSSGFADANPDNNAMTVHTWIIVGGLGGIAVAPVPTPSVTLP